MLQARTILSTIAVLFLAIGTLSGCDDASTGAGDEELLARQEHNKASLQELYDKVLNGKDVAAADSLITPDRPDHDPNLPPEWTKDREGFKMFVTAFHSAFPDARFTSEFMVAEGDMVISYNNITGTHLGTFLDIPATGNTFSIANADVVRFNEDGLIAEHWGVLDMIGLMRQLGVIQ